MENFFFEFNIDGVRNSDCVVAEDARDAALKLIRFYGPGILILHTYDSSMTEIAPKDIV